MATCILPSIVVLLAAVFHSTSGCKCAQQSIFCSLDYGIKGTITNIQGNETAYEDLIYSVQVSEVYRNSSEGFAVGDTIEINTFGSDASCGVTGLQENVPYLIAGDFMSGSYSLHSCSSVVLEFSAYDEMNYNHIDIPCSASFMTSATTTTVVAIFVVVLNLLFS